MKISTFKILSTLACILCGSVGFSQTYTMDWGSSFSWATGNTSGTANNINGSGRNVTVTMAFNGSGAYIANYPAVNNNNATATMFQVQNSTDAIQVGINLGAQGAFHTSTFVFSGPIQNLNFGLADIDGPGGANPFGYLDSISVRGITPTGATVIPTVVKYNAASTILNVDAVNQASANAGNGANVTSTAQGSPAQDGTVFVSFTGNAVSQVIISYTTKVTSLVLADPANEAMAIGNFLFDNANPPVAASFTTSVMGNTAPATDFTDPSATDDETVAFYNVATLPLASEGVLTYYNGSSYVAVTAGQQLTAAEIASLRFDPVATFSGNASFTYTATDNRALTSAAATVTIPVETAAPPTAYNRAAPIENANQGITPIPALSASSTYGQITTYTIQTIPTGAQGVLYLCDPTCVAVTAGQTITDAQRDKLSFDPAATFSGTATFSYSATNAGGVGSNIATYSIPVRNNAPAANNILSLPLSASAASTAIPSLAGSDVDGSITQFNITAIPAAGSGVLYLCNPSCVAVTNGQLINLADINKLQFDPAAGFTGNAVFTYTATDNSAQVSPAASFTIPIRGVAAPNIRPLADNVTAPYMSASNAATLIPALSAADLDGTISLYTIETIPGAAAGVLSYCNNSTEPCTGSVITIAAGNTLTAAQLATLKFDPAATFTGTASFTYSATDNNSTKSNIANYSIPVTNVPPVATAITMPLMNNGLGQTDILPLTGVDADGSIASFNIVALPSASAGVLYYFNGLFYVTVSAGQSLTLSQATSLRFDPAAGFTGNGVFTYTATDNSNLVSQAASYTIPISGATQPTGSAPSADSKQAPAMPNTNAATSIPALTGTDDGSVSGFVITSIPSSAAGVLSLCNPGCVAITAGQVISAADAANLRFDPAAGFEGDVQFGYAAVDNIGRQSNVASYVIPVTGSAPRTTHVTNTSLLPTAPSTPIAALAATDADGTVASFTITSIPQAAAGILYFCNPSCVAVTAGQTILLADAGKLQFDPAAGYSGAMTSFNYYSTDNSGKTGNQATFTIPLASSSTLPVTLTTFSVAKLGDVAKLSWTTENETNLSEYVIEKSSDGVRFTTLASAAAKGGVKNEYTANDNIANLNGAIYYRLKMVDADGQFTYSKVLSVSSAKREAVGLSVVPNPVKSQLIVKIGSDRNFAGEIRVLNGEGRVMLRQRSAVVAGDNVITVSGSASLANGTYMVVLDAGGKLITERFVVAR